MFLLTFSRIRLWIDSLLCITSPSFSTGSSSSSLQNSSSSHLRIKSFPLLSHYSQLPSPFPVPFLALGQSLHPSTFWVFFFPPQIYFSQLSLPQAGGNHFVKATGNIHDGKCSGHSSICLWASPSFSGIRIPDLWKTILCWLLSPHSLAFCLPASQSLSDSFFVPSVCSICKCCSTYILAFGGLLP